MAKTLMKIINPVLRSLFVSGVMFVIFFSVITGTFPPDFGRLSTTYSSLQQMSALSREYALPATTQHIEVANSDQNEDKDLMDLEKIYKKRAEFGEGLLLGEGPHAKTLRGLANSEPNADLKKEIQELQAQLFRLQQRVSELEDQVKPKEIQ